MTVQIRHPGSAYPGADDPGPYYQGEGYVTWKRPGAYPGSEHRVTVSEFSVVVTDDHGDFQMVYEVTPEDFISGTLLAVIHTFGTPTYMAMLRVAEGRPADVVDDMARRCGLRSPFDFSSEMLGKTGCGPDVPPRGRDPLRGTGRTTTQLLRALVALDEGNRVTLVGHTLRFANQYMLDMVQDYGRVAGVETHEVHTRSLDQMVRCQDRHRAVVFYDHFIQDQRRQAKTSFF